jgi:hypothetical protein
MTIVIRISLSLLSRLKKKLKVTTNRPRNPKKFNISSLLKIKITKQIVHLCLQKNQIGKMKVLKELILHLKNLNLQKK